VTAWLKDDIWLAFVREFNQHGDFTTASTRESKRERIRVAIWRAGKTTSPFFDSGLTYAQAYERYFGQSLEMRKIPRYDAPAHDLEDDEIPSDTDEEI
jgi:hypothetical protein